MKLKLKLRFITCLLAGAMFLLARSTAFGQEEKTLSPVTVTTSSNVTKAVNRSFNKSFSDAVNTQWYKVNRKYLAEFMMNDQQNRALFQKNGSLIYHITYGFEKDVPADVLQLVKGSYNNYNITRAINVEEDNRNIWVINMETDKKLVLVRVEDGALEEVGNYDKSE